MSEVTSLTISTAPVVEAPASTAAAAVTRPEYIPEKFWKGNVEEIHEGYGCLVWRAGA
jgi:hypothetical protein